MNKYEKVYQSIIDDNIEDFYPAMGMSIFCEERAGKYSDTHKKSILDIYNMWLGEAGVSNFTHYKNESTKGYKKINTRAINSVKNKLNKDNELTVLSLMNVIEAGDKNLFQATPSINLILSFANYITHEDDDDDGDDEKQADNLKLGLPLNQLSNEAFLQLFIKAISLSHGFICATAGHVLIRNGVSSLYSYEYIERDVAKYACVEFWDTIIYDRYGVQADSLRTVNWLTAISYKNFKEVEDEFLKIDTQDITLLKEKNAVIFQAGEAPVIGDVTNIDELKPYIIIDKLLKPLRDKHVDDRKGHFSDDSYNRLEQFYGSI